MAGLVLSNEDRRQLQAWASDPVTPSRLRTRACLMLALAAGLSDREVARQYSVARQTVALWRRRVTEKGSALAITADAPGRGRKPSVSDATRQAVCAAHRLAALNGHPRSVRDLAREFSLSPATVHRTLRAGVDDYGPPRSSSGPRSPRKGGDGPDGRRSWPAA